MDNNRAWMYDRYDHGSYKAEFFDGVDTFLNFAIAKVDFMDGNKIKCPCTRCRNCKFFTKDEVQEHLYRRGFMPNYYWWTAHGEQAEPFVPPLSRRQDNRGNLYGQLNDEQRMVFDIAGPSFVPPSWLNVGHNETYGPTDGTQAEGMENFDPVDEILTDSVPTVEETRGSQRFYDLLKAADEPLYSGCETHTELSFVSRLMSLKSEYNVSQDLFNGIVQLFDEVLPSGHKVPKDYYQAKKVYRGLELPVVKIHMCPKGCMLYWKDDSDAILCKHCGHERYERIGNRNSGIPHQVLWYFPLGPRLERLYAAEPTAEAMTWHARYVPDEGIMSHPSHGEAWKKLDATFPDFASEPRNVRLGLCTDGFAPFNTTGKTYSCWPVIVTPYNLPPDMCMNREYMFLSLLIPGPKNPKQLIDVCLQPLVDELQQLWESGITTYDVSRKENFTMRAALLWTINDFPAYAMLSGWSTAGNLACPHCMEHTDSFRLEHGRKACWFDCSRRFLESNHPFRKNKKDFIANRVVSEPPPPMLTGEQIWERIRHFSTIIDDPNNKPAGYGTSHKWVKQSIFWRLEYWPHLLIRHNLDVMHIEKNVFDNFFDAVMNFTGKTKDNLNARKDLAIYCRRPRFQVDSDYKGKKPKADYSLTRDQKIKVLEWIKSLKFPDGYASNMGRCVKIDDCKLTGMKSHDCHVFMERLLPIAFKELLPPKVWGPLCELSYFFRSISSSSMSVEHMKQLQSMAPVLLCKLERIFPPSLFDSMEHLLLHLPYEARVGGPPQYRWMYKPERLLGHLKKKIKQPGRVEGSICEAYLKEEAANFSEHYFKPHVPSKLRKVGRNNETSEDDDQPISIFNYPGRSSGKEKKRWMTDARELNAAHVYILRNCLRVDEYIEKFIMEVLGGEVDDDKIDNEFAGWFKDHVLNNSSLCTDELLYSLAWGPSTKAKSWPVYFVNGYKFHTLDHGFRKSTMNSGVCVKACEYENDLADFYGLLEEIIKLEYISLTDRPLKLVMFKCRWFSPTEGVSVDPILEVNHKKLYKKYEPFVLAQQAVQVYYAGYPGARRERANWWAVCKTVPRDRIAERWRSGTPAYQPSEPDSFGQMMNGDVSEHLADPLGTSEGLEEEDMEELDEYDDEVELDDGYDDGDESNTENDDEDEFDSTSEDKGGSMSIDDDESE